jgi:hypothetical protein
MAAMGNHLQLVIFLSTVCALRSMLNNAAAFGCLLAKHQQWKSAHYGHFSMREKTRAD